MQGLNILIQFIYTSRPLHSIIVVRSVILYLRFRVKTHPDTNLRNSVTSQHKICFVKVEFSSKTQYFFPPIASLSRCGDSHNLYILIRTRSSSPWTLESDRPSVRLQPRWRGAKDVGPISHLSIPQSLMIIPLCSQTVCQLFDNTLTLLASAVFSVHDKQT